MKMNRFILPLVAMALLATGCTKEYVSYNYGAQVETIRVNVNPGDWQFNEGSRLPGGQNYYYCTVDIPSITAEVFDYGTVQAYVWNIYNVDQNLGAWNTLPFVYPLEVFVENDDGTQSLVIVPENLRFEWEKGKVTFIIQDLDGYDPVRIGSPLSFKVNITHNM